MNLERQRRQIALMQEAPRCSATSKLTGCRCRAPALAGKTVCRFHGGRAGALVCDSGYNTLFGGDQVSPDIVISKRSYRPRLYVTSHTMC